MHYHNNTDLYISNDILIEKNILFCIVLFGTLIWYPQFVTFSPHPNRSSLNSNIYFDFPHFMSTIRSYDKGYLEKFQKIKKQNLNISIYILLVFF